jgi:hypothetical protein
MEKISKNFKSNLPLTWPRSETVVAGRSTSPGELLPEPLAEIQEYILSRILNMSMIYFSVLVGIVILAVGVVGLLMGFSKPNSGMVLAACGFMLISGPIAFLKFSKDE